MTLPLEVSGSAIAGGFVVRDLSELDVVAYCLLSWLDSVYRHALPKGETDEAR